MKHPEQFELPGLFTEYMRAYQFPLSNKNLLCVITSTDGKKWEHVSVSGLDAQGNGYTPSWDEMCFIKDQFFDAEQVAIQIHPKKSEYVNSHKNCLHLWRDITGSFDLPGFSY